MKKIYYIFIAILFFSCTEKEKYKDYDTYFVGYKRDFLDTTGGEVNLYKKFEITYKDGDLWYSFMCSHLNDYSLLYVGKEPPGYVKHYYGKWHPTTDNTSNYDAIAYQKRIHKTKKVMPLNNIEEKVINSYKLKKTTP